MIGDGGLTHDETAPATSDGLALRSRIAFRFTPGGSLLMLPEGVVSQVLLDSAIAPVPNVKPWLAGVASLRGNFVPVFDLGQWLGDPPLSRADAYVLVIAPGPRAVAVLCSELPTVIEAGALRPVGGDDPMAVLAPTCADSGDEVAYAFDPAAWLARVAADVPGGVTA